MIGTQASQACAIVVAQAIRQSRKFGAKEHQAVLAGFTQLRKDHPEFGDEIDQRITQSGNRSAFAKDLAKAGLVSEGDPSAWVNEIGSAIDTLAEQDKALLYKVG